MVIGNFVSGVDISRDVVKVVKEVYVVFRGSEVSMYEKFFVFINNLWIYFEVKLIILFLNYDFRL